jgi:hypothetical protein
MKKLRLLAKENNTKIKSYGRTTAVYANELMFNGSVKFYWLKKKLKYFKHWKHYDYDEFFKRGKEIVVVYYGDPRFKKSFFFYVVHNPYTQYLDIYLELPPQGPLNYLGLYLELFSNGPLNLDERAKYRRSFDLYQNAYVTQRFKEFVCVWTRLALKYKNFKVYKRIIHEYIFYHKHIKNYVQIIEMGSQLRNQCVMHKLPVEIRKKIYDMILKQFPEHLLECREFSKKLFPY